MTQQCTGQKTCTRPHAVYSIYDLLSRKFFVIFHVTAFFLLLLFKLCAGTHVLFFFSTVLDECKKGFENQVPLSAIWPTPASLRIRTSPGGLCLGFLEKGLVEEDARGLRARPKRLETTATSRSARYQPT